jgi:hypothetical protein
MRPFKTTLAFAVVSILCAVAEGRARFIESWPYDKLFQRADLAVIVRPLSVRDAVAKDKAQPPEGQEQYLIGVVTKFKVLQVVKGEYKPSELELVHFRMKPRAEVVINGPLLASFHTKSVHSEGNGWSGGAKPDYMLFLKRDKDGRFTFVSGQFDPQLSVKQVVNPLP